MSVSTWIESTITRICPQGTIDAVRVNTSAGQKSAVVWKHGTREVWLGESPKLGRKVAIYDVLNDPAVIAKIKKLEVGVIGEALLAVDDALMRGEVSAESADECEPVGAVVIESNPYVALGL